MGLDTVELVMAFEERFGVSIPDAVAAELVTPRHVIDYLMATGAGGGRSREEVAQLVRQVIEKETAVYDFTEDSRFVEDMHLD
jgi:hypothetical protein